MNKKEISITALNKNLKLFRKKAEIIAMVKANAYGHGVEKIVKSLDGNVAYFGVANLTEAKEVRLISTTPILIVEPCKEIKKCIMNGFSFFCDDLKVIKRSIKEGFSHLIHIKINCGMNRFGFHFNDKNTLKKLKKASKKAVFGGLCTHFSNLENDRTCLNEYSRFCEVKNYLNISAPVHLGGSGTYYFAFDCDMIRVGIGLYGYPSTERVMKITSEIIAIRDIKKGEHVGYRGNFVAQKDSKIGVIGLGYADGLMRKTSGFYVKINGKKCDIVGNICMDCCFVDITNIPCRVGDKVIVMEDAERMASHNETISYEILTNFNKLRM